MRERESEKERERERERGRERESCDHRTDPLVTTDPSSFVSEWTQTLTMSGRRRISPVLF